MMAKCARRALYRYWLDTPLVKYTIGYWSKGTTSVDAALINKVAPACSHITLGRGDRAINIGRGFLCGRTQP